MRDAARELCCDADGATHAPVTMVSMPSTYLHLRNGFIITVGNINVSIDNGIIPIISLLHVSQDAV